MAISSDSRYTTATISTNEGPNGETLQEMHPAFPTSRMVTYTYYRVVAGERVDTIAHDFYGKATLWWMIADANPEILDWAELSPGDVIRVPNV